MSIQRFFFMFVLVYFLFSSVVTFNTIGIIPSINVLVIGITIALYIVGIDVRKIGTGVTLVLGIGYVFFYLFPDLYNKSQAYTDAMNLTFSRDSNYGELGDRVLMKCAIQGSFDQISLVFECIKIVYFDAIMSGIDYIFNQFGPLPENACSMAVKDLIDNYPEAKERLPEELLNLINGK